MYSVLDQVFKLSKYLSKCQQWHFHTWFNDEKSVFGDRMFFSKLFFDFLRQPGGRIEVKPELNFRRDFLNILSA
jgi:hypothetical protein